MQSWLLLTAVGVVLAACSTTALPPTDIPILPTDIPILPTDTVAPPATIAPATIPPTPNATNNWALYENEVLGYSFKYPSECFFGPMPADCKQSPPEERAPECLCFLDAEDPWEVYLQAFVGDPDEGLSLFPFLVTHYDSWAFNPPVGVDLISWLKDQWSHVAEYIPDEPNAIIDEVPVVWVSVPGSPMAPSSDEIYFIRNDLLVRITMLDMDQNRELYEQILSTFQFVD